MTDAIQGDAGRELDAVVAERVMRLPHVQFGHRSNYDKQGLTYGKSGVGDVPHYSTKISAAWAVVEEVQLRNPGWRFSLLGGDVSMGYHGGSPQNGVDENSREFFGWIAEFLGHLDPRLDYGDRHGRGHADTAPLAICRAALAACAPLNSAVQS